MFSFLSSLIGMRELTVILKGWFDIAEHVSVLMARFATFLDYWVMSRKVGLLSLFAQLL